MAREVGRLNMFDHLRKNAFVEGILKQSTRHVDLQNRQIRTDKDR